MPETTGCTIFHEDNFNKSESSQHIVTYHPYKIMGARNPSFDRTSGRILDLKEGDRSAIKWAFDLLSPMLNHGFLISLVPSHDAEKTGYPLQVLVKMLVNADSSRMDASDCLVRHTTISKLARGGDRSIQTHLNSIKVKDAQLVVNKQVLVIDDVQTTGNSLKACSQLLYEAGARIVRTLSIAKTAGY